MSVLKDIVIFLSFRYSYMVDVAMGWLFYSLWLSDFRLTNFPHLRRLLVNDCLSTLWQIVARENIFKISIVTFLLVLSLRQTEKN
jgi:hypothetical protein